MANTTKGILIFILAWTFIPIMDGIAKYLSGSLPVMQIVWARYFFTCFLVFPIIILLYKKKSFTSENYGLQILRGSFLFIATLCFFYSISIIPLANALALAFVYPLFITILSPIFLNEKFGIRRFSAVIFGLVGVLFIIKPGFGEFNNAMLAAMGTGLAYALYMISTRKLTYSDTPLKTLAFTGL
ncbi:MAG: Riboflavin transporter, partial [Alphaproteobacteria bacterium MarineAlpha5_Bin11]